MIEEFKGFYETPNRTLIPIYWSYPEFITVTLVE
jgi:hypothetical protein